MKLEEHLSLMDQLLNAGEIVEATAELKRAKCLYPDSAPLGLIEIMMNQASLDKSKQSADVIHDQLIKLVEHNPDYVPALIELGRWYVSNGYKDKACTILSRARSLSMSDLKESSAQLAALLVESVIGRTATQLGMDEEEEQEQEDRSSVENQPNQTNQPIAQFPVVSPKVGGIGDTGSLPVFKPEEKLDEFE